MWGWRQTDEILQNLGQRLDLPHMYSYRYKIGVNVKMDLYKVLVYYRNSDGWHHLHSTLSSLKMLRCSIKILMTSINVTNVHSINAVDICHKIQRKLMTLDKPGSRQMPGSGPQKPGSSLRGFALVSFCLVNVTSVLTYNDLSNVAM